MNINKNGISIDDYNLNKGRSCRECGKKYKIITCLEEYEDRFFKPWDYAYGCATTCMECWFGVSDSPNYFGLSDYFQDLDEATNTSAAEINLRYPTEHRTWYDNNNIEKIDLGNFRLGYKDYIADDCHIVILPLSRVVTEKTIFLPCGVLIYPESRLKLSDLNISNNSLSQSSSLQTKLSGITVNTFNSHPLIVLPLKFNWAYIQNCDHDSHMEIVSTISEGIDILCFDFLKYKHCGLSYIPDQSLPSSPGQISSNSMMSGAIFLKEDSTESIIIGGEVFTHKITKGLGLVLQQPEWDCFPQDGEIGRIVIHALSLYSQMIQTQSSTSRFIQSLSLLEFLAFPTEYKNFKKVKSVISKYVASSPKGRKVILDRFEELTSKIDQDTKKQIGLRTRIIHIGGRLERLLPSRIDRERLFKELDGYLRCVIDHMIQYSYMSLKEYDEVKERL